MFLIIPAAILFIVLLWGVLIYNSLIRLRNQSNEAWSDIDVQLKRRHDLIPNLVNSVKGYAKHESSVLDDVTELRQKSMQANSIADKGKAEQALTAGLGKLIAVAENYPDLKASANFENLQNQLGETEDKISSARRYYNGVTRDLNTKIQSFPDNLLAGVFHFSVKSFFEMDDSEKSVPDVSFN
jgi:LemA protein